MEVPLWLVYSEHKAPLKNSYSASLLWRKEVVNHQNNCSGCVHVSAREAVITTVIMSIGNYAGER